MDRLKYSISYTTRKARGAERDGVEYYFVSEEEFLDMRDRGEFLESAEVHGFLYGTHRATIEHMLDEGSDVILDIDVQGARQIVQTDAGSRDGFRSSAFARDAGIPTSHAKPE